MGKHPVLEARDYRIGTLSNIVIRQLEKILAPPEDVVVGPRHRFEAFMLGAGHACNEEAGRGVAGDDAARDQSRIIINSAVVKGTQAKERIFGCGIIWVADPDETRLPRIARESYRVLE